MKSFKITTQVISIQTVEYVVEAETEIEARDIIISGVERGEGEIVIDETDWSTEQIKNVKFIEDLD